VVAQLPADLNERFNQSGQERAARKPGDHKGRPYSGQLATAAVADGDRLLRNSDHTFDPAHDAADHTAHDATNHGADWTGRALADGDALLASTHNALGLGRERRRKCGNNDDSHDELRLHEQTPPPDVCGFATDAKDLVLALWRQREANVAANQQNRRACRAQ
jgi:hypothetical protein